MVQYSVAQLLKEPTGSTRKHAIREVTPQLEEITLLQLEGSLVFMRTDAGIWVHGSLGLETPGECSRCLEPFLDSRRLEFDDQYYPSMDIDTGAPIDETLVEDDSFRITHRHVLDLSEAIRQHIIARTPMKPLCQPSCRGICPQCGVNRNETDCHCAETPRDARWDALFQLRSVAGPGG